jgi:hypothetical protein
MSPHHVKLLIGGVLGLVVIGGLGHLASTGRLLGGSGVTEKSGDDDGSGSSNRSARFSRNYTGGPGAAASAASKNSSAKKSSTVADAATTAGGITDFATTTSVLAETEAETRERERYEAAQRNAFKYRKLDPEKVKPVELAPTFENASKKYEVPKDLLAALAYVESGGAHRDGENSMEAGYGVMNLRENNLVDTAAEGAALLGKAKEDLFYDQKLNIEAAAALLARYHEDALASGVSDSEAWYMAVSQYSGRPNPELAAAEADEVAGFLIKGFQANLTDGGGSFSVPPTNNPLFLPKNWKLVGLQPPTTPGGTYTQLPDMNVSQGVQ